MSNPGFMHAAICLRVLVRDVDDGVLRLATDGGSWPVWPTPVRTGIVRPPMRMIAQIDWAGGLAENE